MGTSNNHVNGHPQPPRRLYGTDSLPPELARKTPLERALQYSKIPGFEPIPIVYGRKRPKDGEGWHKRPRRTEDELREAFGNGKVNIGTRLGVSGLTDVDLDCHEAIVLAPFFLPETGFVYGRVSAPRSHWFYYSDPPVQLREWKDPVTKHKILELRGLKKSDGTCGLQTVLPGSLRYKEDDDPPDAPAEEWIEFDIEGTPQNVDAQDLIDACADLSAAVMMARVFPQPKSGRNEAFLAFAGMLAKGGYSLERATRIHQGIFRLLWPEMPLTDQAAAQVRQTYLKHQHGEHVTGFTRLEQLGIDRKHLQAIERGLELTSDRRTLREVTSIDVNRHSTSLSLINDDVVTNGQSTAQHPDDVAWSQLLTRGDNNQVHSNVWNVATCLSRHPAMRHTLSFDEFRNDVIVAEKAPKGVRPGPLDEFGLIEIRCWIEVNFLHRVGQQVVNYGILKAAREQCVHPVRAYLESVKWDGEERARHLFPYYCGACQGRSEADRNRLYPYWEAVSKMFGISAVARIFKPGCQVDHMLVLEGKQGIGKSQALRTLFGNDWFTDQMPPLEGKDASLQHVGKWCIEFAEFAALQRTSNASVKAFLTRQTERYRPPYGSKVSDFPRQCVFTATVNPDEYLADPTGNRRYWPVKCFEIRCDLLARDRDQLWAEYLHYFKQGVPWWPQNSKELQELLNEEQKDRELYDAWTVPIGQWLKDQDCPQKITTHYIHKKLDIPAHQQSKATQMRIADILRVTFKCERHRASTMRWYTKTTDTHDILNNLDD